MKSILQQIGTQNNFKIKTFKPLFGGDINSVYHLNTNKGEFVIKCNDAKKFPDMFAAEYKGLKLLRTTNSFLIPEVFTHNQIGNTAYLLMAYISPGHKPIRFWRDFGVKLAQMHRNTNTTFGLEHDNYIGSLPQYNAACNTAPEFFIEQRLVPQFKMAVDKGFSFADLSSFYKNITKEIPSEPSALIHGDLWNGNYMVSASGEPVLIDPAVAYAPREMDIAMMQLFGGFPAEVFEAYEEAYPLQSNWKYRTDIWQLYYLLVHLNLFGAGYLAQVNAVLRKYS